MFFCCGFDSPWETPVFSFRLFCAFVLGGKLKLIFATQKNKEKQLFVGML
jgi:hypothetical protein